jgi:tRNA 2-thiocytidine biosynthesis protein TtcA
LFDFAGLALGGALPAEGGDTAFDREEFSDPSPDPDDAPAITRRSVISILDSRPKEPPTHG